MNREEIYNDPQDITNKLLEGNALANAAFVTLRQHRLTVSNVLKNVDCVTILGMDKHGDEGVGPHAACAAPGSPCASR